MLQTLNKQLLPVSDPIKHLLFPGIIQSDKGPIANQLMHTGENLRQMNCSNQLRVRGIRSPRGKVGILQHLTHVSLLLQSASTIPEGNHIKEEEVKQAPY